VLRLDADHLKSYMNINKDFMADEEGLPVNQSD